MTTPLMNLQEVNAGVGGDSPTVAWNKLIRNFQTLDSHTHTAGSGAKITVGALSIDADLTFNAFQATNLKQAVFASQASPLTTSYGVYVQNGNLIYRSATTNIPLTTGGNQIAGTPGNITNMTASQSVNYNLSFFQFFQNTGLFGLLQTGGIAIGPANVANPSNFVTLNAAATDGYTLTFPAADPASNKILWSDNTSGDFIWVDGLKKSGTIAANQVVYATSATDLTGLTLANNQLFLGTASTPISGQLSNSYVASNAAIAGTKIAPVFGTQNITNTGTLVTTGVVTGGSFVTSGTLSAGGITSSGDINFSGISGNLFSCSPAAAFASTVIVAGNAQFDGSITFGNASTDALTFFGRSSTDFLPNTNATRSLGGTFNKWNALLGTATIDTANIGTGNITTANITTATIPTANITNASITTATIPTANITNASITTANIFAANISTIANIPTANITTADIRTIATGVNFTTFTRASNSAFGANIVLRTPTSPTNTADGPRLVWTKDQGSVNWSAGIASNNQSPQDTWGLFSGGSSTSFGTPVFTATPSGRLDIGPFGLSDQHVINGRVFQRRTNTPSSSDTMFVVEHRDASQGVGISLVNVANASAAKAITFFNTLGLAGSIQTFLQSTSYFTTSDARLKDDIRSFNGVDLVKCMTFVDHRWIAGGTRSHGVIAQDLYRCFPAAVSKGDDNVEVETPWSVDYSKLVPVLGRAIQELTARLELLENQ